MKLSRLHPRDTAATILVAAVGACYGAAQANLHPAGISSTRGVAAVVFALGLCACAVGAHPDIVRPDGPRHGLVTLLSMLGATALVWGILAIAIGSEALLTALVALIGVVWAGATLRHLLTPPTSCTLPAGQPPRAMTGSRR